MNKTDTFKYFLATQSPEVSLVAFVINLSLTALLSFLLGMAYVKYGHALSNRKYFARNFVVLSMTTMLIITIVKSSLALSLGLIGALSIVRFRAAIKEPEELTFLFLNIAIGLGFGANQRIVTLVAFVGILAFIIVRSLAYKKEEHENIFVTITDVASSKLDLMRITDILKSHCSFVRMKRFDENTDIMEATYIVHFDNLERLKGCRQNLKEMSPSIKISYLDSWSAT